MGRKAYSFSEKQSADSMGDGDDRSLSKATLIILLVIVVLLMGGLIAGICVGITRDDIGLKKDRHGSPIIYIAPRGSGKAVPDPSDYTWAARYGSYRFAAVASPSTECNEIGTNIMASHAGGAVDAAIATMFCLGVVNPMFSGIGGGHFMMVYDKPTDTGKVFIAREVAPAAATEDMYTAGSNPPSSIIGSKAIGVPGELKGFIEEHKMYGKSEWKDLVQPSIDLARDGVPVTPVLADLITANEQAIRDDSGLRGIFFSNGEPLKAGDMMRNVKLAATLEKIRDEPEAFYNPNSQLAQDIVDDIGSDGIITAQDLANYEVSIKDPLEMPLSEEYTLLTPPPPSSGFIIGLILRILKEYNFDYKSVESVDKAVETYQRVVESFKHAFAQRTKLGDADFVDNTALMDLLTSDDMIAEFKKKIDESINQTKPLSFYNPEYADLGDTGTQSMVIYSPDGGAVAVTSSINTYFGSMVFGTRTGIIFNNQMDDFAKPGQTDAWGLPAAPDNLMEPGKRPMSSQSPSIILNSRDEVAMILGGEGGGTMITAIVQTILKGIHFNWKAQKAVDDPRLHHQLTPEELMYQPGFSWSVLDSLEKKGHKTVEMKDKKTKGNLLTTIMAIKNACAVCVEAVDEPKCRESCMIEAAVDARRIHAEPDGY